MKLSEDFFKNKRNIFEAFAVFLFFLILAGGFSFGFSGQTKFLAAVTPICGEGEPCGGGGGGGGILPPPPPPPTAYTLSVSKTGTGAGTITSSQPSKITCGALCSSTFNSDDSITLYMSPSTGSVFASWSGCSSIGTDNSCVVTMNATRTVTANFISIIPPAPISTSDVFVDQNCGTAGGTINTISNRKVCEFSDSSRSSCVSLSGEWIDYIAPERVRSCIFLFCSTRYNLTCVQFPQYLSQSNQPTSIASTTWETILNAIKSFSLKPSGPVFIDLKVNGKDGPLTVFKDSTGVASVTISWITSGVTSCNVYKKENNSLMSSTLASGKTSGSQSEKITADNTKFSIVCGDKTDSVTVKAVLQQTAYISVSPDKLPQGGSVTLTWGSSNVDSCSISSNPSIYSSTEPQNPTPAPTATVGAGETIFSISCTGRGGTVSDETSVNGPLRPRE